MQVLCIESCSRKDNKSIHVVKGEIYNSLLTKMLGKEWRGIDKWHKLEELPINPAHVSLFIDLPDQEGVIYSKQEELVETI